MSILNVLFVHSPKHSLVSGECLAQAHQKHDEVRLVLI